MAVEIKNRSLHKKLFSRLDYYDELAIAAYKRGDRRMGNAYEVKSDALYRNNYSKVFKRK